MNKPKRPRDIAQLAHHIAGVATGNIPRDEIEPDTRNPAAVALGKLGGAKGGKARASALSATKRKQIAKKAAKARWGKKKLIV